MPRFAVLEHDSPRGLHWDFMLEEGGVLLTWALPKPPDATETLAAEALPDHRLAYLDYEGPVSGQRGSVTNWDRGEFQWDRQTDDQIAVLLEGRRLAGRVTLARCEEEAAGWRFQFIAGNAGDAG